MLYVVKYTGPFGFIKPWTAVRDSKTFSQQFLTPSIIEGIRQKLEVSSIVRYKLSYSSISAQQEQTQTRGWEKKTQLRIMVRNQSILERGVMIDPTLYLAFEKREDAEKRACPQESDPSRLPLRQRPGDEVDQPGDGAWKKEYC